MKTIIKKSTKEFLHLRPTPGGGMEWFVQITPLMHPDYFTLDEFYERMKKKGITVGNSEDMEVVYVTLHFEDSGKYKPEPQFLSPIQSERNWQERHLKKLWPGYPDDAFTWQYLNGLIIETCKAHGIEMDKDLPLIEKP